MQDKNKTKLNECRWRWTRWCSRRCNLPKLRCLHTLLVMKLTLLWDPLDNSFSYGSPATAPENSLDDRKVYGVGWASKCRVCSSGRLVFPTRVTRGFNIELSGNQYFSCYLPILLQGSCKQVECFVPSTSPSGCQAQGVRMLLRQCNAVNKYAMNTSLATVPENTAGVGEYFMMIVMMNASGDSVVCSFEWVKCSKCK